ELHPQRVVALDAARHCDRARRRRVQPDRRRPRRRPPLRWLSRSPPPPARPAAAMADRPPPADPAGDAILTVEGLHTFIRTDGGIVRAVDDVSFTLRRGEILGLVAESGSGEER